MPLFVGPERLKREWQLAKTVMIDVRRRPTVVRSITSLETTAEVTHGASAAGEGDGEKEGSEADPAAGLALG